MDKKEFVYFVAELILQKKGFDVKILNLEGKTSVTDYFVVCSASSTTMVKAIADHLFKETKLAGENVWRDEGYSGLTWVLLDFVDVVVHIFNEETRKFYNLEGLWGDAEIEEIPEDFIYKKKPVRKPRKVTEKVTKKVSDKVTKKVTIKKPGKTTITKPKKKSSE
ncbi:MAG: ribosome silencing factor [Ignavibacteriae bacterium]|nr:ribosome silencing factor [Ignavibacteriota bacterium]